MPVPSAAYEINKRHFYAEKIQATLIDLGFSEIYTSSFCSQDTIKLENALASDKGYLRSTLTTNMRVAREKNISHRDLLGLLSIKLFEIGTVFAEDSEEFRVVLAVQTGTSYKAKVDDILLTEALTAINNILLVTPSLTFSADGMAEFSLDALLPQLPTPIAYEKVDRNSTTKYQSYVGE
jgi:phenylalanyl-tRNA synthetase beta subunit